MLKRKILFITLLVCSLSVQAGDSVNNGGGLSEQTFWSIYAKLEGILQSCLESPRCPVEPNERLLLSEIIMAAPQEKSTTNQLQFISNQSHSYFFDGQTVLIAKTDSKIGSTIWINRDLIYRKASDGTPQAVSASEALEILIDQLLIHQNQQNPAYRSYISKSLGSFFKKGETLGKIP